MVAQAGIGGLNIGQQLLFLLGKRREFQRLALNDQLKLLLSDRQQALKLRMLLGQQRIKAH